MHDNLLKKKNIIVILKFTTFGLFGIFTGRWGVYNLCGRKKGSPKALIALFKIHVGICLVPHPR
jgi:hypothetical protein